MIHPNDFLVKMMSQAARTIEDIPVSVFPEWRTPLKVHIGVFVFLYALSFAKFQVILIFESICLIISIYESIYYYLLYFFALRFILKL